MSDFSSKLGLPKVETIESIDANHMQMAKYKSRSNKSYRAIAGVLKQFLTNKSPVADLLIRSATQIQQEETLIAR